MAGKMKGVSGPCLSFSLNAILPFTRLVAKQNPIFGNRQPGSFAVKLAKL
jgi:hypothetical protein